MSQDQQAGAEAAREAYREAHRLMKRERRGEARARLEPLATGDGPLAPKARLLMAETHLADRAFPEAEALLRRETERLLSPERRREIAGIYLELAEAAVAPRHEGLDLSPPKDHAKALRLLGFLVDMELPRDLLEDVLLRQGRMALDGELHGPARDAFRTYLLRFDPLYRREILGELPGRVAAEEPGRHVVEARLGVAEAELRLVDGLPDPKGAGDDWEFAREASDWVLTLLESTLRHLEAEDWPEPVVVPEGALPRARFFRPLLAGLGRRFRKDGVGADGPTAARRAVQTALEFLEAHPGTPEALELMRLIPAALVTAGFPEEGLERLRGFLEQALAFEDETTRRRTETSRDLGRFGVGVLLMALRRFDEAGEAFLAYLAEFPDGAHWQEAQEAVYRAQAASGMAALEAGDFPRCRERWVQVISRRGLDDSAGWLALAVAYTHVHEADLARREEKPRKATQLYQGALEELAAVARRYPGSVRQWAHHYRGEILHHQMRDLEAAVREYRAAALSPSREALSELEAVELSLESPRVFRAAEAAAVTLRTRNVEKVQVRRYRINLADFFSKYHTTEQVSRLDLDLVSPEESWEETLPEYARYQDLEVPLDLRVEGAGAWAVTVEGADFEATVLVVKSDLELVAVTSQREALILVKDAAENRAARGATVQVWGGPHPGQILELESGEDGVARGRFSEAPGEAPYVFASRGDHVAVSGLELPGSSSVSLRPKGYLQPARPVFLPGETARLRGVIRTVRDGCYRIEAGASYQVALLAPDGRVVGERRVRLSRFGTFQAAFRLSPQAALGRYTARVVRRAKKGETVPAGEPGYQGHFEVQHVEPAKVFLELETSRPAALAGDRVMVRARAGFYTGAPLVGQAIALTLPDSRRVTLETDAEGRAAWELDTTPFFRHPTLSIRGELPGEDVQASVDLPLLPAACQLEARLPSPRHNAGERLTVPLKLTTPDGAPMGGWAIQAEVQLRAAPGPSPLPRPILDGAELGSEHLPGPSVLGGAQDATLETLDLETDAEGKAALAVVLPDPGEHRLVFTVVDDAGRALTVTRSLQVDRAPSPDLAIEADSTRLRVGDEASVRLRYKDAPGLGLLLFTGDEILDYRVHDYEKGVRAFRFPVEPAHLPNLRLVALATGARTLHRAQQDLEVRRRLEVAVSLPEGPLRPGAEVEAKLTARDERGAPVEADLCLSLVDKGLLERYPDQVRDIVAFFEEGLRREVSLSAGSSVAFRRRGAKREISREVLEEEARLRDEAAMASEMPEMLDDLCESMAMEEECVNGFAMMGAGGASGDMRMRAMAAPMMQAPGGPMPPPCPAPARKKARRDSAKEMKAGYDLDESGEAEEASAPAEREELAIGAVWFGSVVTGADGAARVTFEAPERTSAYRVLVRGAGEGDLFGEDRSEAIVRRDLYGELKLPSHLFEGDVVRPVVAIQNSGDFTGEVELTLSLEAGGSSRSFPHTLKVPGKGSFPLVSGPFPVPAGRRLVARLEVRAAGAVVDSLRKETLVRPWGVEERDSAGGVLTDSHAFELGLPGSVTPGSARLTLTLHSPDPEGLLDEPRGFPMDELAQEVPAARALAWIESAAALAGREDQAGAVERLRGRVMDTLGALVATQDDAGGFPWIATRERGEQDAHVGATAWALLALQRAHALGWWEDRGPMDRAVQHLQGRSLDFRDRDERVGLLALACAGGTDFSELNRRFRNRTSLGPEAAALLGLAFHALDKGEYAGQLLGDLGGVGATSPLLDLSLTVLLQGAMGIRDAGAATREQGLRERLQRSWSRDLAFWVGQAALARLAPRGAPQEARDLEVQVLVDGRELGRYLARGETSTRSFEVEGGALRGPRTRVELRYQGRGRLAYRAELTGFSPVVTESRGLKGSGLGREEFFHSPRLYKGRRLRASEMQVTCVETQDFVEDQLTIVSGRKEGETPGAYTVLTRWIPGGLRLDRTSLPSGVLRSIEDRGRLVLVFRGTPSSGRVRLLPFCPGTYRALGAELRCATNPRAADRLAGERSMVVLAPQERDDTPYSWTTSEHVAFGLAHFQDREYPGALEHLGPLTGSSRDSNREVVKALLWMRCLPAHYAPDQVVDLFEVLERRYPDVTLPYDKLLAVGRAYHDSGEDEAACLLWRATLESSFRDDVPVAAELEGAGEYLRGVEYLERLFWEYPDLPLVAESLYGLSQDVYAHKDARDQVKGLRPHQVVKRAIDILNEFLRYFADLPYADAATFSLLNALRELAAHDLCKEQAGEAAARYADGPYVDRFRYMRALAAFFLDDYETAVEAAREVAAGDGPDQRTATFLLGQMYQALGRTAQALETYRQVEHDFPDAARSIRYLERRSLSMPEVATSKIGDPVEIELAYVGVTRIEVLAYRVDLMRLFLKERNLDRIAGVNLAGITPTTTFERELAPAPAGTTGTARLELPFEEVGAYLVLVRAQEAFASGLALVTPLHMETTRYPDGVRVTVLEGADRAPVRDVYVKVSDGGSFSSGRTDLRGALTLSASGDQLTVVSRRGGDEYAFHRAERRAAVEPMYVGGLDAVAYDQQILATNMAVQQQASATLRANFGRRGKADMGVKAAAVRK